MPMRTLLLFVISAILLSCNTTKEVVYDYDLPPTTASTTTIESKPQEEVYQEGEFVLMEVDKAIEFVGGYEAFYRKAGGQLKYPAYARENKIQGKVEIGIIVNQLGQVERLDILKDPGGGCGEATLKAIQYALLDTSLTPAIKDGYAVKARHIAFMTFRLE